MEKQNRRNNQQVQFDKQNTFSGITSPNEASSPLSKKIARQSLDMMRNQEIYGRLKEGSLQTDNSNQNLTRG